MCTEDNSCCPMFESIQSGKIPEQCKKCKLYNKINKIILYSKIGLGIAVLLFILLTFLIY